MFSYFDSNSNYVRFVWYILENGSIIVPWVNNLKLPDAYYIISFIAAIVQLLPSIIMTLRPIKDAKKSGFPLVQMLIITLGVYWVTSGLFSTLEQIAYNKMLKRV